VVPEPRCFCNRQVAISSFNLRRSVLQNPRRWSAVRHGQVWEVHEKFYDDPPVFDVGKSPANEDPWLPMIADGFGVSSRIAPRRSSRMTRGLRPPNLGNHSNPSWRQRGDDVVQTDRDWSFFWPWCCSMSADPRRKNFKSARLIVQEHCAREQKQKQGSKQGTSESMATATATKKTNPPRNVSTGRTSLEADRKY